MVEFKFDHHWEEIKTDEIIQEISLDKIRPNPYQPREYFEQESLQELAKSIEQTGVFQPIILRKSQIKGYEIIAGERRYRASKIAGKTTIPAIVREITDVEMMQIAVLENLQRENLTPLEEARSYQTLMSNLNLTQQELSEFLGKSRSYIANYLRLLKLPDSIKELINKQELSVSQARTIISLKDESKQLALANKIINDQLSVRDVEDYVNKQKKSKNNHKQKKFNIFYDEIERQLTDKFGTIVNVYGNESEGKIEFKFLSQDDLAHLLDQWNVKID